MKILEQDLYLLFEKLGISYLKLEHMPLFTCEDAKMLDQRLDGIDTKNLFLRNNKGNKHFLVSIPHHKTVDLKKLGEIIGAGGLGFASAERLKRYLNVTPGSVTMLALVNDTEQKVQFIMDNSLREAQRICCHPLRNTATLSIEKDDMLRFIEHTGHQIDFIDVPEKSD